MGSVPGRRSLSPLNLKGPDHVRPLAPSRLLGPQLYVKEHLIPAVDLPFQLDLQGVPLAQKEAIDFLPRGLGAGRRRRLAWYVTYLAARSCLSFTLSFLVPSHEKRHLF